MDKSTLVLIINGLIGIVLALISLVLKDARDEIKLLRQRVHDALNQISAIEAVLRLRKTERK